MPMLAPMERLPAARHQLVHTFVASGVLAGNSDFQIFDFFNKISPTCELSFCAARARSRDIAAMTAQARARVARENSRDG